MRLRVALFTAALVITSLPAFAGNLTYNDLKGKWVSTSCKEPQPYTRQARTSEMPASELNAQIAERNRYVNEAYAYMNCISQEAKRDSDASGLLVTQSAKAIIDKTQAEVEASLKGPHPQASVSQSE